jgi:hypothetical protein
VVTRSGSTRVKDLAERRNALEAHLVDPVEVGRLRCEELLEALQGPFDDQEKRHLTMSTGAIHTTRRRLRHLQPPDDVW